MCKLCKASGSRNWLLTENDRNAIIKASAKAQALFAAEEETEDIEQEYNAYDNDETEQEDENANWD